MEMYVIKYFDKTTKSIKDKYFKGIDSFEEAMEWGKKNINNFNPEMVRKMYKDGGIMDKNKKIGKVMHEFKEHELKTSYGKTVTNPKQAMAIALSESRKMKDGGELVKDKIYDVIISYEDTKAKLDKYGIKKKQFWRKIYKLYAKNENDAKQDAYKQFISEKANKHKIGKNVIAFELKSKMKDGGDIEGIKVGDTIYRAWFTDNDGAKSSVIIKANSLEEAEKKANLIDNGDGYFSYVSNPIKIKNKEQLFEETRNNESIYQYNKGGDIEDDTDLFEDYDNLPKNVKAILDKYSDEDYDYETLAKLKSELNKIGYTFEYGLDAEPYDLKKMEKGGSLDKIVRKFNDPIFGTINIYKEEKINNYVIGIVDGSNDTRHIFIHEGNLDSYGKNTSLPANFAKTPSFNKNDANKYYNKLKENIKKNPNIETYKAIKSIIYANGGNLGFCYSIGGL
jgi:uncharacterized protein YneF (UPF0154 family)